MSAIESTEATKKEKKSKKRSRDEIAAEESVPPIAADSTQVPAAKTKRSKKDKSERAEEREIAVEELCPVAKPLAERKLAKKVLRTVKKGKDSHYY